MSGNPMHGIGVIACCPCCENRVEHALRHCPTCGISLQAVRSVVTTSHAGTDAATVHTAVSATVLRAGSRVGDRYRLVAPLGAGSMGNVWEAVDERRSGKPCAIKHQPLNSTVPDERTRFRREAVMLGSVSHPHICATQDWFEEQDNGYLVLELVPGRTAEQEIISQGAPGLPEAVVLAWACQIAGALSYLHHQTPPIVYRDLKPENIQA